MSEVSPLEASVARDIPSAFPAKAPTLLRQLGLHARKGLGQHFLVDRSVLSNIMKAASIGAGDTVVEVGPGLGILTEELAKGAGEVIAVELDRDLASYLRERFASFHNVRVVNADILKLSPPQLLSQGDSQASPGYKVVANLPYYVASPVLRHFLEAPLRPSLMVVMLQREVAKAITAKPGDMRLVGVSVQLYGKPTIVSTVSPGSFHPRPKVSSAVLRIETFASPRIPVEGIASFFKVVRAGFSAPRKQLRNSLAQGLVRPAAEIALLLEGAGISPQRRAESLNLEEWARVWTAFCAAGETPC